MLQAKAYAAAHATAPIAPFSLERRDPREHDVLIDILFCGICHSDIHQARDGWGGSIFPMVPGHEIAGIVKHVGSKVSKFKIGDSVGVGCFVESCRECQYCTAGLNQYCAKGIVLTYNGRDYDGATTFGGYSDKIVVNEDYVLRIPGNLALNAAAPLMCAGITLYSPLRHWEAAPSKKVAIIGLGGLGHMGVKLSHAMGAETTVLSHSLKKQEDGRRLGAHHFFATTDPETFKELQGHFDLIINTVSAPIDWNEYLSLLRVDGSMVNVGVPEQPVPLAAFSLIRGRRSLAGSSIGSIGETQEMLDFCGEHNIVSDVEMTPIQKVNEAYERMIKSDVRYRFVIDLASLKSA